MLLSRGLTFNSLIHFKYLLSLKKVIDLKGEITNGLKLKLYCMPALTFCFERFSISKSCSFSSV